MLRSSATFLLAVLAASVLTTAAPLNLRSPVATRAEADIAAQFSAACTAAGIAGGLTASAVTLLDKIQTNDQGVTQELDALKGILDAVTTAGGAVGDQCKLAFGDNNSSNNENNNDNNSNNQNSNNGNDNANNTASAAATQTSNNAKDSASSSSTSSAAEKTQTKSA